MVTAPGPPADYSEGSDFGSGTFVFVSMATAIHSRAICKSRSRSLWRLRQTSKALALASVFQVFAVGVYDGRCHFYVRTGDNAVRAGSRRAYLTLHRPSCVKGTAAMLIRLIEGAAAQAAPVDPQKLGRRP